MGVAPTIDELDFLPRAFFCQRANVPTEMPSRAEKRSADSPLRDHWSSSPDHSDDRYRFRFFMHAVYATAGEDSPRSSVRGLLFKDWTKVFPDPLNAQVIAERLTERAEVFLMDGKKYRDPRYHETA